MIVYVYIMNLNIGNILIIHVFIIYINNFMNKYNVMQNIIHILKRIYIHCIIFYRFN